MGKKGIREILSPMTFTEKIDYLWTYYKWVLAIAAAVITVICIVISCVRNKQTETLYSGMLINVELSEEGNAYLKDQWFELLGGDPRKETVELMTTSFLPHAVTSSLELEAGSVIQVTALVAAREIDYFITDQVGFDRYQGQAIFAPLTDMLSAEQLEELNGQLVYREDEEEGRYPIAIDISNSRFAAACITGGENVYLAFPGNTGRTARNGQFLEYLLHWQ